MHCTRCFFVLSVLAIAGCPTGSPTNTPAASDQSHETSAGTPLVSQHPAAIVETTLPPKPRPDPGETRFTASAQDAQRLCEEIVDTEETPLIRCSFIDGLALANGVRVDVLELEYDEFHQGEVSEAHLVVRSDEFPSFELIGTAYQVPGEEEGYQLGNLEHQGDTVTLWAKRFTTTYPNTGDPDAEHVEIVESAAVMFTCRLEGEDTHCTHEFSEDP